MDFFFKYLSIHSCTYCNAGNQTQGHAHGVKWSSLSNIPVYCSVKIISQGHPRLSLNSKSSCLCPSSARITVMCCHARLLTGHCNPVLCGSHPWPTLSSSLREFEVNHCLISAPNMVNSLLTFRPQNIRWGRKRWKGVETRKRISLCYTGLLSAEAKQKMVGFRGWFKL